MTSPQLNVWIGFGTLGPYFVNDDPVKGVLDNTSYTLADSTYFVDVTNHMSGQISINRGRSRETDQYQCGSMTFTLRNEDRAFDPSNTASPTGSTFTPRTPVAALLNGNYLFYGYVDDIVVRYEQPNISYVDVTCVDAFSVLSNMAISSASIPAGTPGAAISSVLDQVGFGSNRNILAGYNAIQASTQTNTDALTLLQTLARSDQGFLFMDYWGTINFLDRYSMQRAIEATFSDDATELASNPSTTYPYKTISQKSQAMLLYNQVSGTRTGGTQQTAQNAASVTQYQLRALTLGQLECASDSTVSDLCNYVLGKYSTPEVRFDHITVDFLSFDWANFGWALLGLDLADPVSVTRTPSGTGTPAVLQKRSIIDGISWAIDISANTFNVTYALGSLDSRSFLLLDDTNGYGTIDTVNKLGF